MLQINGLTKTYDDLTAVNNLHLSLETGDIFGFIGPNGAGKTTTIRMLSTLLPPTAGTATIDGIDLISNPDEMRGKIGYMPDYFGIYDDVKSWEYLDFFAAAYKIPSKARPGLIDDVLELTDLTVKKDAYVNSLSRGMKQRLCLAKTLLHDPKLLLLDEPASGLDPRARIELKELLKELSNMGKTILISSHILPELADFCNKVGIIEKGNLLLNGGMDEILAQINGGKCNMVRFADGEDIGKAIAIIQEIAGVAKADEYDGQLQITFDHAQVAPYQLLNALVFAGCRVESFTESKLDLEDLFMSVTKGLVQ